MALCLAPLLVCAVLNPVVRWWNAVPKTNNIAQRIRVREGTRAMDRLLEHRSRLGACLSCSRKPKGR